MYGAVSALIGETRPFPGQCIRPWGCFFWGSIRKKVEGGRSEAKKFSVARSCSYVSPPRVRGRGRMRRAPCLAHGGWPMATMAIMAMAMAHGPSAHGPWPKGQGTGEQEGARSKRAAGNGVYFQLGGITPLPPPRSHAHAIALARCFFGISGRARWPMIPAWTAAQSSQPRLRDERFFGCHALERLNCSD
jgi:hypothetical protein